MAGTLGNEAVAIASLLAAIDVTQADVTKGELNLVTYTPTLVYSTSKVDHSNIAVDTAKDALFTALSAETVVGRLVHEDATAPSAILVDRTGGRKGATIAQVVFSSASHVGPFVAGSNNMYQSPYQGDFARLIAVDVMHNLAAHDTFVPTVPMVDRPPQFAGQGTFAVTVAQKMVAKASVAGAGATTVYAGTVQPSKAVSIAGAGATTTQEAQTQVSKAVSAAGKGNVTVDATKV